MSKSGFQNVKKPVATHHFEIWAIRNLKVVCGEWFLVIFGAKKAPNQSYSDFEKSEVPNGGANYLLPITYPITHYIDVMGEVIWEVNYLGNYLPIAITSR